MSDWDQLPAHALACTPGAIQSLCYLSSDHTQTGANRPVGNLIVTGITFGVFMTEALIHYNMGQAKSKGEFKLSMPPAQELAKIAAVTATFSVVTGLLVKALPKNLQSQV